jgi:KDO2-lipid IV(A) lauroyltransferase
MKKDFLTDYLGCILFRLAGPLIRAFPKRFSLFLGRCLGELTYYLDLKHKSVSYSNIKTAFASKLSPCGLSKLTKDFFRAFGENFIEALFLPSINKEYINKYITIEGLDHVREAFKRGKGVIFMGVHAGNWELSNIIGAQLGYPFNLFVGGQRLPRLNKLLNSYRSQKGCKLIERKNQTRQLVQVLKNNEAIGITIDQGGKTGCNVEFMGKDASMSQGAVRLALKYDSALLPSLYYRIKGPYIKVVIGSQFEIKRTGNEEKDLRDNLQAIASLFEEHIIRHPKEYLWSYKIWKYAREKNILILDDGKAGHLRQSEAVAKIAVNYLKDKGITAEVTTVKVDFKNSFNRNALILSSLLAGKYHCQGCLWCLKNFLTKDAYLSCVGIKPDLIISCGSALEPVNFVLSRENLAKSILIMRPSVLSARRFDLVVMPRHDRLLKRKNVLVTEGALNLIDEDYLKEQSSQLIQASGLMLQATGSYIGLLIGGDAKDFHLTYDTILEVIKQIKLVLEKHNMDLLITTSRRTTKDIESLLKEEFKDYSRCKLLVIANEKNLSSAVGGILGLSQIVIASPESISMISEAVNSKKYVLVFDSKGLNKKHRKFLKRFSQNKYIYFIEAGDLSKTVNDIVKNKPSSHDLKDSLLVRQALKRII